MRELLLMAVALILCQTQAEAQTGSNRSEKFPFGVPAGMQHMPKFSPEIFGKHQMYDRVPAGTVLTGIMEDTVSSRESKPGDVFALRLEHGWSDSKGRQVLPKGAKIVGSVVSTVSAKKQNLGYPGTIQVSLQTLVLPDGRSTKFYGFFDHNPEVDLENEPGKQPLAGEAKSLGIGVARAGYGVVTRVVGFHVNVRSFGYDCKIDKGEAIPIRVSRSLDMTAFAPPIHPGNPSPAVSQQDPPSLIPSVTGPNERRQMTNSPALTAEQMLNDANAIFNQPVHPQPQPDLPEPF